MPRSLEEILAHADELAERFENGFEPTAAVETDPIEGLQRAVVELSNAQRNITLWVTEAREAGYTWSEIGEGLGTTGEAARQRYGGLVGTGRPPRSKYVRINPETGRIVRARKAEAVKPTKARGRRVAG